MNKIDVKKSVFRSEDGKKRIQDYYGKLLEQWPGGCERKLMPTVCGDTHVISSGNPDLPPLLLLHGASGNSSAWMGYAAIWAESFRLVATDMPGEPGLSEDRRMSPSGDDYILWLESLLDRLGIAQIPIVGMSLGSFVALRFASAFPDRVSSLSLITASGLAPARISYLFKALPLMMLGKWGADRNYRMISHGQPLTDEVFEFGRLVSKYYKPMLEPIPMLTDEELGCLTMPIQYFGGDHDVLLNSEASANRLKKSVPQAEINLLQETGHVILGQGMKVLEFVEKNSSEYVV